MRKTIIIISTLLLLLSGCSKSNRNTVHYITNTEKDVVERFEQIAEDNDARLFLTFQITGKETEIFSNYMNNEVYDDVSYVWSSTYMIYDEDGNKLLYFRISQYEEEFEEDNLFWNTCVANKITIEYNIRDGINHRADDEIEDMCDDLDGYLQYTSDNNYDFDDDDDYYDEDDDDDDYYHDDDEDDDKEFKY